MVKKQGIINLSRYITKSYAFVVPSDSDVTFLRKGKDGTFCLFLYGVFFKDSIA